jgi:glycosyltransferase involved in cell wall biosynthesis
VSPPFCGGALRQPTSVVESGPAESLRLAAQPLRVAVLWLGRLSLDTAARVYLTELLGPLGAQPGLLIDVHVGDPRFEVARTCRAIRHQVPHRFGPAARIAAEHLVAAKIRRRYDVMLAPFGNLPATWRGRSVVVHHNVLAFGPHVRAELSLLRSWWRPVALGSSVARATQTLAVSAHLRDLLLERYPALDPARIEVVPHGVSTRLTQRAAREPDPEAPQLLAVSALWPYKRLDQTIEAFADVAGSLPRARLVIAGPNVGHEQERLQRLAHALGVETRITFAGNVSHDELSRLYAGADALLYLSDFESFGMPLIEAMAVGVPVLAKRLPGLVEVGADAPQWVEAGATRERIAFALRSLLADRELRKRRVQAGLARSALFTWERAAELTAVAIRTAATRR